MNVAHRQLQTRGQRCKGNMQLIDSYRPMVQNIKTRQAPDLKEMKWTLSRKKAKNKLYTLKGKKQALGFKKG